MIAVKLCLYQLYNISFMKSWGNTSCNSTFFRKGKSYFKCSLSTVSVNRYQKGRKKMRPFSSLFPVGHDSPLHPIVPPTPCPISGINKQKNKKQHNSRKTQIKAK